MCPMQPGNSRTDGDVLLTIGERIRLWRERRDLTRPDLALLIGCSARQLARYENDEIPPPADVLRRLVEELDVSADYLLGLKERTTRVSRDGKVPHLHAVASRAGPPLPVGTPTQPPLVRGVSSSKVPNSKHGRSDA